MWAPAETPPMDTRVGLMLRVLDESRALVETSQPCTRPAHERHTQFKAAQASWIHLPQMVSVSQVSPRYMSCQWVKRHKYRDNVGS